MGKGHEFLRRINEVLDQFERAVVRRERKKLLDSKISLQQAVDSARQRLIETVVQVVKEAKETYSEN
jgi:cell division FtsZ-interacting protein ZapD